MIRVVGTTTGQDDVELATGAGNRAVDDAVEEGSGAGGEPTWLTQPDAAALVGCSIAVIDWHSRRPESLLRTRPRHGSRPTLEAESVREFAAWWAERERAKRARRRRRDELAERELARRADPGPRRGPEPPQECVATIEAAVALDMTRAHVLKMLRTGVLDGVKQGRRWWVAETSLQQMLDERARWATFEETARIAGCTTAKVAEAVRDGILTQRDPGAPVPTVLRTDIPGLVEHLAKATPPWGATLRAVRRSTRLPSGEYMSQTRLAEIVAQVLGPCTRVTIARVERSPTPPASRDLLRVATCMAAALGLDADEGAQDLGRHPAALDLTSDDLRRLRKDSGASARRGDP